MVFFKNRRDKIKEKGFTSKKVTYKAPPKDKSKDTPEYQLKQQKHVLQQEEGESLKKPTRRQETQESSSSSVNLTEQDNQQSFNYKKSWLTEEDEFLIER